MDEIKSFIIVYNYAGLRSFLWLNNGKRWFLCPFEEGEDVYAELEEGFEQCRIAYNDLPESLRNTLEQDELHEDIKAIYQI